MLRRLICQFRGHRVVRNRVWNDGVDFRANCARCGTPLIRDSGWRPFNEERYASPHRRTTPPGADD